MSDAVLGDRRRYLGSSVSLSPKLPRHQAATNLLDDDGLETPARYTSTQELHQLTMSSEKESTPPHISIQNGDEEGHGSPKSNGTPRSSSGWDGKLRIEKEKRAELVNPEAISDPEYSDEEQVLEGQTIEADEGTCQ